MKTRLAIVSVLFVATASLAQSGTDKLKELSGFVGTWKCSGKAYASEMGPEHATTGTVTGKWILNAKWLEVRYTEDKTSRNPTPFAIVAYWGWDEGLKQFVSGSVDNMGGYAVTQSSGWNGDALAFEGKGHMGPMTMNGRDSFTRSGDNQMTHSFSMQDQAGGWKKLDDETCKK